MTALAAEAGLAIDLRNVEKTYRGRVHALRGLSMQVHRGEVFGLLGPNGAGKSTLVKILMTVVRPSRCEGSMLGAPVGDRGTLARVGYLPENPRFPEYLRGAQTLDLYGALSRVPKADRRKRIPALLELVGMRSWADRKVGTYSKGMRQRLGLAQALMNDPALVLLDEPTDGVDPVGRREIREILVRMRAEGRAVMLNSHLLSEAETVCERVAILVKGQVARQGTMDDLGKHSRRYEIEAEGGAPTDGVRRAMADLDASRTDGARGALITAPTDDAARIQPLLDALRATGAVIRSVRPVRSSLEDLFMEAVIDPETGRAGDVGAARKAPPAGRGKGAGR